MTHQIAIAEDISQNCVQETKQFKAETWKKGMFGPSQGSKYFTRRIESDHFSRFPTLAQHATVNLSETIQTSAVQVMVRIF